jgi:general secretion pathway protein A
MYTAFYGLREKPFALAPDPRFLFLAASHREALAHVLYGVEQGEGFIAVTGEVGTGKTTLCRTLLERLGRDTEVAFVFNPMLSGEDLLRAISTEFALLTEGCTRAQLMDQLNQFLLEQKRSRRRVLLIVDEAQNLAPETLEEIRLLSNLETSTSKLIQILLFGQPELDDKLDSKQLRQLRQRISVRWSLGSLSAAETREYVRHRLRIAAERDPEIFSARALAEIHRRARGIPRLVNLLCDRALLAGYAAGQRRIGPDLVGLAAREILGARRRLIRRRPWVRRSYVAGAALLLIGSGVLAWQQWTRVAPRASGASAATVEEMPPVGAAAPSQPQPMPADPPMVTPVSQTVSKDAG